MPVNYHPRCALCDAASPLQVLIPSGTVYLCPVCMESIANTARVVLGMPEPGYKSFESVDSEAYVVRIAIWNEPLDPVRLDQFRVEIQRLYNQGYKVREMHKFPEVPYTVVVLFKREGVW